MDNRKRQPEQHALATVNKKGKVKRPKNEKQMYLKKILEPLKKDLGTEYHNVSCIK